jgi:hypothetical protein
VGDHLHYFMQSSETWVCLQLLHDRVNAILLLLGGDFRDPLSAYAESHQPQENESNAMHGVRYALELGKWKVCCDKDGERRVDGTRGLRTWHTIEISRGNIQGSQ